MNRFLSGALCMALVLAGSLVFPLVSFTQGFTPSNEYYRDRDAFLSHDVYEFGELGYSEPEGFQLLERVDRGGFQAGLYRDRATGDHVVVYRGTDEFRDWIANSDMNPGGYEVGTWDGSHEPSYSPTTLDKYVSEARSFYRESEKLSGSRPRVTGHSQGGFLAQIVGTEEGVPTTTFNAPGVPENLREHYGINATPGNVTNYGRDSDLVFNINNPHLGRRIDEPDVEGVWDNHSIAPIADEAEVRLSGYRQPADLEEYDQTLRDLGMEEQPGQAPRSEEPAAEPQVEIEPLSGEPSDAESAGPSESALDYKEQEEELPPHASGAEESAQEPVAESDRDSERKTASREPEGGWEDLDAQDPESLETEGSTREEPEPVSEPDRDSYDKYKHYAAEHEEEATKAGVTDLEDYESSSLEDLNARWDEYNELLQDELGAVEIGVVRLSEEPSDPWTELDQLASEMDPELIVDGFRETLKRDRGVARRMEGHLARIQQDQRERAVERQKTFNLGLRMSQDLRHASQGIFSRSGIPSSSHGTGEGRPPSGTKGEAGVGRTCPRIEAQAMKRVQALGHGPCGRHRDMGLCDAHRCNLETFRIQAWAVSNCPAVSAGDRQRMSAALRDAERKTRMACRNIGR
ncbi:MAG: alpha/beta hydrolase family protein [bacterium]